MTVAEKQDSVWAENIKTIVYAVAIALVIRAFLFQPFNIPSGSMKPTLLVGDYLFVSKYSYGYSKYSLPFAPDLFDGRIMSSVPERGDVAVFRKPGNEDIDYIKRIIGLPGDRIQMKTGVLHINGNPVGMEQASDFRDENGLGDAKRIRQFIETLPNGVVHQVLDEDSSGLVDNTREFVVPADHVFAMGDNRDNSQDSRFSGVGYVPLENLVGRAEIIFFSHDQSLNIIAPWTWPGAMRFERFFQTID